MRRKLTAIVRTAVFVSALQLVTTHAATITDRACQFCAPHAVSNGGSVIAGDLAETRWFYLWSGGWFESFLTSTGHSFPSLWMPENGQRTLHSSGYGSASAMTFNGSIVVGQANGGTDFTGGDLPYVPFRWTEATGLVSLGRPTGVRTAGAFGLSADGSTIMIEAGSCSAAGCWADGGPLYRWTQASGFVPLGFSGHGQDVSADASVVVGRSDVQINESVTASQAFRWTESGGLVGLGTLSNDYSSDAHAVSADGLVVVGTSAGRAFRWVAATGMVDLGPGEALDVSADGSIIVGSTGSEAFYWTQASGMRLLSDVLHDDYGLDMTGWFLDSALAMSADGRTIVGRGDGPHGSGIWTVNLVVPEPSSVTLIGLGSLFLITRMRLRRRMYDCFQNTCWGAPLGFQNFYK